MLKKVLKIHRISILLVVVLLLGTISTGVVLAKSSDNGQVEATISFADAEAIALEANPGTRIIDTELEKENGVLIYEVELSNGKEVEIDASTGVIIQTELDDDDDCDVNDENDDRYEDEEEIED